MAQPEVEYLFETQVKEFRQRYSLMREKTRSMYKDHEGFRVAFQEIWENGMELSDRQKLMEVVMKRVDENLPPPKYKALMLLGKSCPEFFEDELTMGKTISMIQFMDHVVNHEENSTNYPFHDRIKTDLETFLRALPASVYPQFAKHPKEAQYTWKLLWEQRSFWICHFALNLVAEMCTHISKFQDATEKTEEVTQENMDGESEDGPRPPPPTDSCDYCGKSDCELKRCSRCKKIWYCSRECQKNGWAAHKHTCAPKS